MKVAYCQICRSLVLSKVCHTHKYDGDNVVDEQVETQVGSCRCGHVAIRYWDDGAFATVAALAPDKVCVYGAHNLALIWRLSKASLKDSSRIIYYITYPISLILQCIVSLQVFIHGKGEVWEKPLSEAICQEVLGGVTFYTFN